MTTADEIRQRKRELRARAREARRALPAAAVAAAARRIAEHGIGFLDVPAGSIVGAFASMPDELQTAPLRTRLYAQGYRIALPVIMGKGKPLIFRAWAPGDNMGRGVWDIPEPKADKPELLPDVMLTALLAFDDWGWRLGYGGGFYDRTLRALRALKPVIAVGLAYDEQHVDSVPHLDYDERLDWVLTPSGPRRCKKG